MLFLILYFDARWEVFDFKDAYLFSLSNHYSSPINFSTYSYSTTNIYFVREGVAFSWITSDACLAWQRPTEASASIALEGTSTSREFIKKLPTTKRRLALITVIRNRIDTKQILLARKGTPVSGTYYNR